MKKIILIGILIPFASFAGKNQDHNSNNLYQELCAKEPDPVKRQNYCYMMESSGRSHTNFNAFQKETAVV